MVLSLLVAGNGVAAAATKPDAVVARLAATTVFDAAASSKIRVRLDKPSRFTLPDRTDAGSLRLSGGGRMIGFVLKSTSVTGDPVLILGGRTINGDRRHHMAMTMTPETLPPSAPAWTLPAGEYDLYLMTDGAPARLALMLDKGVTGRSDYRMSQRVATQVARPTPEGLTQGHQAASATGKLNGRGALLSIAALRHSFHVSEVFFQCTYAGQPQITDFAPGCPGADTASPSVVSSLALGKGETGHIRTTLYSGDAPLVLSEGYSLTNVGVHDYVDYTSMWLTF